MRPGRTAFEAGKLVNDSPECMPAALALAAALNPLLHRLWVHQYTGNANFVLATTIVHSLALTAGVVNIVGGACAA